MYQNIQECNDRLTLDLNLYVNPIFFLFASFARLTVSMASCQRIDHGASSAASDSSSSSSERGDVSDENESSDVVATLPRDAADVEGVRDQSGISSCSTATKLSL